MATNANATEPEVMKAVLLNSADKIQGILGMDRTVLKINGTDTWLQSDAHTDPNMPLDIEMGAGHLNAERALQQFSSGEFASGNVPLIGWDYGFVDDSTSPQKYVLNQMLPAGSYVSATLVWDRQVLLDAVSPPLDEFKPGDGFIDNGFFNLDLHLLPAGSTNKNQAIWSSTSTAHNLEHMFASISTPGNYELWVELNDQSLFASHSYALAWWAAPPPDPTSRGDYDGNGTVGPEDYIVWRAGYGTANLMADGNGNGIVDAADYVVWRNNLGMMVGSANSIGTAVPEPSTLTLLGILLAACRLARQRPSCAGSLR
jgi:hypothetical protein